MKVEPILPSAKIGNDAGMKYSFCELREGRRQRSVTDEMKSALGTWITSPAEVHPLNRRTRSRETRRVYRVLRLMALRTRGVVRKLSSRRNGTRLCGLGFSLKLKEVDS